MWDLDGVCGVHFCDRAWRDLRTTRFLDMVEVCPLFQNVNDFLHPLEYLNFLRGAPTILDYKF